VTPERWQQVKDIFDEAVERRSASRMAYIRDRCGEDDELRQGRQMGWCGLRHLLLRGLEVGMTTLTAPMKMYVRATWEPPRPWILRTPLLLKDPRFAEELPRVQAAGVVAIHLGVALDGLAGTKTKEAEAAAGAAQTASIGGTAVIGIGVAV
jgi:hypothetical protein